MKLHAPAYRTGRHRAGLPGDVDTITGSASLLAPAYRQEGETSNRLAREADSVSEVFDHPPTPSPCKWADLRSRNTLAL